jgi:hypothetical protein
VKLGLFCYRKIYFSRTRWKVRAQIFSQGYFLDIKDVRLTRCTPLFAQVDGATEEYQLKFGLRLVGLCILMIWVSALSGCGIHPLRLLNLNASHLPTKKAAK